MLKNHFKIAWRQLLKNKLVSGINIFGLGLGLTVGIFILLFVQHETNYDNWIPDHENIYRVFRPYDNGTKGQLVTPGPVARALREEIPGTVSASRIIPYGEMLVEWKKVHYSIKNVSSIDSTFFQTIELQFQHGTPRITSSKQDLAILSHATARRIFGNINPVGENILLANSLLLEVAGVLSPPKGPSHLETDMYVVEKQQDGYWTGGNGYTYLRLSPSVDKVNIKKGLFETARKGIIKEDLEYGDVTDESTLPQWDLQPLAEAHLNSEHLGERDASSGSPWQITIMVLIGALILLIAGINYINLSTAQMSARAKEVGIRNVAGATRNQLVGQFLAEALMTTFFALLIAFLLSNLLLPSFNEMMSRTISFSAMWSGWTPFLVVGLTLITGLTTGIFPAFYLSNINPTESLKSKFFRDKRSGTYRNALIVSQFALSIGSVLFVTMVWQQVNYMLQKDLGFEKDQIAVFRFNEEKTMDNFQATKERFLRIPGVAGVTQVSRHPGGRISNYTMDIEGVEKKAYVNTLFGDTEWNKTFKIPIKEGRFFSNNNPTDTASAFVVNENFVKTYNLQTPVGHRMKFAFDEHYSTIIGVVEDFHYNGLQTKISPVAISARNGVAFMGAAAIRFESDKIGNTLEAVSEEWQKAEPVFPVSYNFLDEEFAKQYQSYLDFGRNMTYAAVICLFLALIGLFGLTVFILQRKTKEIGIRKVLGASAANIVGLLSKDFIKLVLLAFLVAAPIAWYFANGWLQNFAYRLEVQWWVFLLVGILAIVITFLTVGLRSLSAALANPSDSIRSV